MNYPKDYIGKVIEGDCLEVMKGMPDKCVDLVLTDPPYGINLEYESHDDNEEDWYELMNSFIPEARRVAKMVIMPSCRIKALGWIYANHAPDWLICWYKGSPGHCAYIGFNDWEPLLVYGKTDKLSMHDHFYAQPEINKMGHPCPKPIVWARHLIEKSTKSDGVVMDCFLGSGTTAVAAEGLNRKWIGIEKEPKYCEIARRRLSQVQQEMFK